MRWAAAARVSASPVGRRPGGGWDRRRGRITRRLPDRMARRPHATGHRAGRDLIRIVPPATSRPCLRPVPVGVAAPGVAVVTARHGGHDRAGRQGRDGGGDVAAAVGGGGRRGRGGSGRGRCPPAGPARRHARPRGGGRPSAAPQPSTASPVTVSACRGARALSRPPRRIPDREDGDDLTSFATTRDGRNPPLGQPPCVAGESATGPARAGRRPAVGVPRRRAVRVGGWSARSAGGWVAGRRPGAARDAVVLLYPPTRPPASCERLPVSRVASPNRSRTTRCASRAATISAVSTTAPASSSGQSVRATCCRAFSRPAGCRARRWRDPPARSESVAAARFPRRPRQPQPDESRRQQRRATSAQTVSPAG